MGRRKSKSKLRKPKTQKWIPKAVASSSCPSPPPSPPPPSQVASPQPPAASPSSPPQSPPPPPPAASPPPPWTELPIDITANILQRLGAVDVLESAQRVCTTWRRVSQDPAMWRVFDMNHLDGAKVCRLAVDRSQGQLIDLRLDYDANDELLTYIVQRHVIATDHGIIPYEDIYVCPTPQNEGTGLGDDMCITIYEMMDGKARPLLVQQCFVGFSHNRNASANSSNALKGKSSNLRRLTLKLCLNITGEGLVEAVKRLPNLEELHLIIMPSVQAANVEVIGISCPMLKSFTLNEPGCKYPARNKLMEGSNNMYALAIAKTMPNLRHLRLFANSMVNEGLQAILDGCPHLESLDIRQCFDLDLQGDLGKRCSKQIKQLKLPSDSISDIDWPLGYGSGSSPIYDSDDFYDDYGYHDDFDDSDSDSDYDHGSAYDLDDWIFGHNNF